MRCMTANDARAVVLHESFPVRSFCKLMAVRLSLGPTLVPVISEHTVEAADGDKENTD